MSWPADADGDVFRSLEALIDFNVDVKDPDQMGEAIDAAVTLYPDAGIGEEDTYFVVQIKARLTYEFVIETQQKLTAATAAATGKCDSWGVLGD